MLLCQNSCKNATVLCSGVFPFDGCAGRISRLFSELQCIRNLISFLARLMPYVRIQGFASRIGIDVMAGEGGIAVSDRNVILLVEPDQELREVMKDTLEKSGYDIVPANDGLEALTILSSTTMDLIISAMRMPNLDGTELMEEIIRIKMNVPVIFMTAYGDVESYMDVMNMGAFDYLNKPVGREEMLGLVEKALGSGAPARS